MTAPARPDLSSLPVDTRINLVLAELVDEATWDRCDGPRYRPGWRLLANPRLCWFIIYDTGESRASGPDYLSDPAAAWALMEREAEDLLELQSGRFRATYRDRAGHQQNGPIAGSRARAVALAVLTKYGHGPLAYVIRPLLDEVLNHG